MELLARADILAAADETNHIPFDGERPAKRRASAFKDPSLWADLVFADALNPAVNIRVIHSGEGTLWTDLKGASLAVPAQGKKQ